MHREIDSNIEQVKDYNETKFAAKHPLVLQISVLDQKVAQTINKLHISKEQRGANQRSSMETEFMKKKIHFVSEFKIYSDGSGVK